jgi:hypothetical protein
VQGLKKVEGFYKKDYQRKTNICNRKIGKNYLTLKWN